MSHDVQASRRSRLPRILAWGLCALLLAGALSAAAHPLGRAPGRLVDVNGHRLHIYCQGRGTPTVVLDAGLGGASLEWTDVMKRVATFTQVCVYDRAGYGWSDMGPFPRTSNREVDELYLLLGNAGIKGPYVMVGHSFGGYNAQLFARRYAYLVAGLVLVDASHPSQVERFQAPPYNVKTAPTSRFGLVQFGEMPPLHYNLSEGARLLMLYQFKHWKPRRTISYELLGFRDSARELREAPELLPMPLAVLTRGRRVWPLSAHGDQLEQLWIELQSELAAQSADSAHIVVREGGHMLHLEQSSMVAYGIALVFDAINAKQSGLAGMALPSAVRSFDGAIQNAVWLRDSLGVHTRRDPPPRLALHPAAAGHGG